MKAAICVGFRPGEPERDALWDKVRPNVAEAGFPIFTADCDPGPFNHAQSMNRAADAAGDWDVAVFSDADTYMEPEAVREAVRLAHETGQAVWPYDHIEYRATDGRIERQTLADGLALVASMPRNPSLSIRPGVGAVWLTPLCYPLQTSHMAVPRSLWAKIGGWDERLSGYGFHDGVLTLSCDLLGAGLLRVPGALVMYDHAVAPNERLGHYDVGDLLDPYLSAFQHRDPSYLVMGLADALVARGAAVGKGWDVGEDGNYFVTAVGGVEPRTWKV